MELGTSMLPDLFGDTLDAVVAAVACTSEARISPPGPEPRRPAISTPNSFARRRAFGEILAFGTADVSRAFGATGAA